MFCWFTDSHIHQWTDSSFDLFTHWGWVTHISISKLTIIGWDNGLLPGQHQAIIWSSTEILLIGPLGTNFSESLIEIQPFSFTKMHLKMSGKCVHCDSASMCLWLDTYLTKIYYLKLNTLIVHLTIRYKPHWNRNKNAKCFFQHNVFEKVGCKMVRS